MTDYKTLLVESRGQVRIITLNQPKAFNPLDAQSGAELVHALELAERDAGVRALVLTGAGKAFAAGANVLKMAEMLGSPEDLYDFIREITALLNRSVISLRRMPKPVVCALNGVAAGGGLGWALGCDLVVAAESARLDAGYIRIAVNPDGGASLFLTRQIGIKRSSDFFLRGRPIKAAEALVLGLVNQVCPDGEALQTAVDLAQELAAGPAEALASTKALLNQALYWDLEEVLETERREIIRLVGSPDNAEGMRAFTEKRRPSWA